MFMASTFRPVAEASVDARKRLSLGKAGVEKDARYLMSVNDDGEILLTPMASIPAREMLIWEDDELRASLISAMERAAAGDTVYLGSFSQYLEED
jgi:hypothetical protein